MALTRHDWYLVAYYVVAFTLFGYWAITTNWMWWGLFAVVAIGCYRDIREWQKRS